MIFFVYPYTNSRKQHLPLKGPTLTANATVPAAATAVSKYEGHQQPDDDDDY